MRTTRILFALALLLTAAAQGLRADDGVLSVGNVCINVSDNTGSLDIVLSGSDLQYNDFQFDITLPDGYTYSGYTPGELIDGHNIVTSNHAANMTRFTGITSATKKLTAQNGTLMTITFAVAEGTSMTGLTATLSNIAFSYGTVSHHPTGGGQILNETIDVTLTDTGNNTSTITDANGCVADVTLAGRTLYKDGAWNTLCLPFNVTISGSPLDGAEARPLTSASISGSTLNLYFDDAVTELVAGTPYIIKWASGDNLTEANLVFSGVTIDATDHSYDNEASGDARVRFLGTYESTPFDATDNSILLMGAGNTLYYPTADAGIGAQRAYFKIGDDGALLARRLSSFNIDFGEDDNTTGIISISSEARGNADGWYSLDGRKLVGKPTRNGIYINHGKKAVIK